MPPDRTDDLGRAKIVITNFHAFELREKIKAPKLTKALAGQRPGVFTEAPDEMVRRVLRPLGAKRNIVVLKRVKRVAFGFTRFRNCRIRVLLYAGKPNWHLLATLTPLRSEARVCPTKPNRPVILLLVTL